MSRGWGKLRLTFPLLALSVRRGEVGGGGEKEKINQVLSTVILYPGNRVY